MDSTVDSRQRNFVGIISDGSPFVHDARYHRAGHGQWVWPSAEFEFQHRPCGARVDAVRARIFRVKWSVDQWFPSSIPGGSVVAVNVSVADRSNGPPEIERVLRFEYGNVRIGHSHLHKSKQARILAQASPHCGSELTHDGIKTLGAGDRPETRNFGLFTGAQ